MATIEVTSEEEDDLMNCIDDAVCRCAGDSWNKDDWECIRNIVGDFADAVHARMQAEFFRDYVVVIDGVEHAVTLGMFREVGG